MHLQSDLGFLYLFTESIDMVKYTNREVPDLIDKQADQSLVIHVQYKVPYIQTFCVC